SHACSAEFLGNLRVNELQHIAIVGIFERCYLPVTLKLKSAARHLLRMFWFTEESHTPVLVDIDPCAGWRCIKADFSPSAIVNPSPKRKRPSITPGLFLHKLKPNTNDGPWQRQKLNRRANCIARGSPARDVILPKLPEFPLLVGSPNWVVLNK